MIALNTIIKKISQEFKNSVIKFSFPSIFILIDDQRLNEKPEDQVISIIAKELESTFNEIEKINLDIERSIRKSLSINNCEIICGNIEESLESYGIQGDNFNAHWLSAYDTENHTNKSIDFPAKSIHFYGNKGGQARSTFLALFAKLLASKGYRVLIVDADIEAPTLHVILGINNISIDSSLMNYCDGHSEKLSYASSTMASNISLISCRPSSESWEADYISFCLRSSISPSILTSGINRIKKLIDERKDGFEFDFVLFDHRTGASHSVIPIIDTWPGPSVIFVRPDNQTNWLQGIRHILSFEKENPGLFVCFDPSKSPSDVLSTRESIQRESLLGLLSDALYRTSEIEMAPEDLESCYIKWFYDISLLNGQIPELFDIQNSNRQALEQVYYNLDLEQVKISENNRQKKVRNTTSSISGAKDDTWFIQSDTTRNILNKDSDFSYILGRKGTGKSRIFREAVEGNIGVSLIAPSEFSTTSGLLTSTDPYLSALRNVFKEDYHSFWWYLIYCRIVAGSDNEKYIDAVKKSSTMDLTDLANKSTPISILNIIGDSDELIILIDGLETLYGVNPISLKFVISSLLQCIALVNSTYELSSKIKFRLFIRMDLIIGIQNIEQQIEGRSIDLTWNEQAQMNFILACIASSPVLSNKFPLAASEIESHRVAIESGKLDLKNCEDILLKIFPTKLRRSSTKTITFIKTYFRDASSTSHEQKATFYPRLFVRFIQKISDLISIEDRPLEDGKISNSIAMDAYENSADAFLNDVKQELPYAIELDEDFSKNQTRVEELLSFFNSRITPFNLEETVDDISRHLGESISPQKAREAMNRMKTMGIFEQTAKDPSKWRAGRVYKSALKMKFDRRSTSADIDE